MFQPPSKENWHHTGHFSEEYAIAYESGYHAAETGKKESDNPFQLSGHERDMDFEDELNYYWYSGYTDYNTEE